MVSVMQQFNAGHERIAAVMLLLPRISECDEFWQVASDISVIIQ